MTQNRDNPNRQSQTSLATTYYALLELHPSASAGEIRRAYRELSKRYHPDTTDLPREMATVKFQKLNEAYATLNHPERRLAYDQKIGYSSLKGIQRPTNFRPPFAQSRPVYNSSAYLDPSDRPLSAGEMVALLMLGLTILACLLLAIAIGLTRGETAFQVSDQSIMTSPLAQAQVTLKNPHPSSKVANLQ